MGKLSMNPESSNERPRKGRRLTILRRILVTVLTILLIATGTGFAYVKYIEGKMQPKGKLASAIAAVLTKPEPKEPVNFLIIGSDYIPDKDNGRSDTIMVLHVDLNKKKAVLISIPRDFYVEIPGYGEDKINHAYNYGGSPLTIETIESFTGLPIHHYVVIDYDGFAKMVDAVGGVTIDVEERMVDYELGDPIEAGSQKMDGITALHYVRWRNDPRGDFTRIEHQQKFARALINESTRIMNAYKLPKLANVVADNVETDMSIADILSYSGYADSVSQENLTTVTLPGTSDSIDGISYVIPDAERIELIMSLIKQGKPIDEAIAEDIPAWEVSVKVLNGCGVDGVASEVTDILANEGFSIAMTGDADRMDYDSSILYHKKEDLGKALKVKSAIKEDMPDLELKVSDSLDSEADILLIVGSDYGQ